METGLTILGVLIAICTLAAIDWSIRYPSRSVWPPLSYNSWTPAVVWTPTFALFGILLILGILGWDDLSFPVGVRFGLGIPMILIGNIVVWLEVSHFGVAQTGGAVGSLRTQGLYRWSRNPQYVADITMILGWLLLAAAPLAFVVGALSILALLSAPLSEEKWLKRQYEQEFEEYRKRVRRFI